MLQYFNDPSIYSEQNRNLEKRNQELLKENQQLKARAEELEAREKIRIGKQKEKVGLNEYTESQELHMSFRESREKEKYQQSLDQSNFIEEENNSLQFQQHFGSVISRKDKDKQKNVEEIELNTISKDNKQTGDGLT